PMLPLSREIFCSPPKSAHALSLFAPCGTLRYRKNAPIGGTNKEVSITSREEKQVQEENKSDEQMLSEQEISAARLALRENAKRVLRESGLAQMLQQINKNELRRRGQVEEYDSLVLLKWGTGYTRRHIWAEVKGNTILFRLSPHRKCTSPIPLCDG